MEVLKTDNNVKRSRKWTEYPIEFVMLFLAVFLGFIAENIRENHIEQQRAQENARTLLSSIVGDTAALNERITFYKQIDYALDTLAILIVDKNIQQKQVGLLYYLASKGMWNKPFTPNKTSLEQLKSTGSLRYFTNAELVNNIEKYDQSLDNIQIMSEASFIILMEARKSEYKIFNSRIPKGWVDEGDSLRMINQRNFYLISNDPNVLNEFSNWVTTRGEHNIGLINSFETSLFTARRMIDLLKNEYNLE